MPEPLVSVKMITYNHAPYIAQAIEGILIQKTNFPIELVIGEDCSTDGTREIVFEYQKKYPDIIRVITSEQNVGMKKNGYRTMKACRGKYIAFCEGDDYWTHPEKLQKQVDHMESHPECGLVYSSYDVFHLKTGNYIKDFIRYRKWRMPGNMDMCDILENKGGIGAGILTCTIMVRRALYEQIIKSDPYLHQSDHFLMGDTQLWAEISTKTRLHFIPEVFATHRITDESASRSRNIVKQLGFSVSGGELGLYLCKKYNLPQYTRDIVEGQWLDASLRLAFQTKDKKLTEEIMKKQINFTWKNRLRYWGVKYETVHYIIRFAVICRNLLIKKYDKWS
jgi:glycosyltransferase involved in cell wall biosynthesis